MNQRASVLFVVLLALMVSPVVTNAQSVHKDLKTPGPKHQDVNPAIDMDGFLDAVNAAAAHRESRRLSEAEFIEMASQPGTIILDARSRERYEELHIAGAINLNFSDITFESLAQLLPDKATRILIYCNNNFEPVESFPRKKLSAALNLSTYVSLYDYGYRNIYELAPLLEVDDSKLQFEGKLAALLTQK